MNSHSILHRALYLWDAHQRAGILRNDVPLYKLNFDGALFESEKCAGLGVILRNHEGQVMVSLTERTMLPFTAIEVEAMAARRALSLALERGFDRVVLEGDSQVLVTALQNNSYT